MSEQIEEGYFKNLRNQILNFENWDSEKFCIFNHEAGTGKSIETHKILGEMSKEYSYRVLYVQMFEKDNELTNTVERINSHAGKIVARRFAGEDLRKDSRRAEAVDAQCLCVTHRMYLEMCKGKNLDLIQNRDILIIDEMPNFLNKIEITTDDIQYLWLNYPYSEEAQQLATFFRDTWYKYMINSNQSKNSEFKKVIYSVEEYYKYSQSINFLLKEINDENVKEILSKFLQLLNNGFLFYQNKFYSYDGRIKPLLLNNNIILDANAGFNYLYQLSPTFNINEQSKIFDYSNSMLFHYLVNTSKASIKNSIDLFSKCLSQVLLERGDSALFITDMENKDKLKEEIIFYYRNYGQTLEEIEMNMGIKIYIDYYGNLIGKNTYRDCNVAIVTKTPNFDYLSYTLTYLLYKNYERDSLRDILAFQDCEVEKLRKSIIAGEIYQSIKRINRQNKKSSRIYLFSTNNDAIDIVKSQLPNINYIQKNLIVSKTKKITTQSKDTKFMEQLELTKQFILLSKEKGINQIQKKDIRDILGIKSSPNFTPILTRLKPWLIVNNIENSGQTLKFV